jgi:GntR family transcriptional regulator, transcriptional repressor for pyruvate dehydrogenase complex
MVHLASPVVRLADTVVTEIENQILDGALRPGDRIPSERKLAEDFGVSRPSIREAIQKLVAKGLLVTRHGGGTTVTDKLNAAFMDPWQDMVKDHPLLHRDVLEVREMLEGQAAALAALRATDVDMNRLDKAYAALDEAYANKDLDASIAADVAFHQAIAEASHNVLIGHLTASLMRVIHDHVTNNLKHSHTRPAHWEQLRCQHRAIWKAIKANKADKASVAAKEHSTYIRESIENNALDEHRRVSALRRAGSK